MPVGVCPRGTWNCGRRSIDQQGRVDIVITVLSARIADGFLTGINAEFVQAVIDQARENHPVQLPIWWASGETLDSAAALTTQTIEELLEAA